MPNLSTVFFNSAVMPGVQLLIGFGLGIVVAALAWWAGALSGSGAIAAAGVGGLIFGLGGLPWASLLLAFFISSSALSRAFRARKTQANEKFAKGSRRDWGQVLANGGLGASLVICQGLFPEQDWPWIAFAGGMAAVNADTWATEIGVLSASPPRLITTGRIVERGASGGVTWLGSLAALAGAALIGGLAALFSSPANAIALGAAIGVGGMGGAFFDSLLGATVQAIYSCPACQKETERHPTHGCGAATSRLRGWRWLNNDGVNFACSLAGAAVTLAAVWLL
jgi:uncharacterized protein (TIGR00297 family)